MSNARAVHSKRKPATCPAITKLAAPLKRNRGENHHATQPSMEPGSGRRPSHYSAVDLEDDDADLDAIEPIYTTSAAIAGDDGAGIASDDNVIYVPLPKGLPLVGCLIHWVFACTSWQPACLSAALLGDDAR